MTVLKTSLRSFFSHKARMLLSGLAIALSVSFVSGTLVFSDTLNTTFDRFFDAVAADVTISPAEDDNAQETGRGATLPASLVERVRDVEGVAAADGTVVNEQLTLVAADGDTLDASGPVFGGDWGPAVQRVMDLSEGREPAGPGEALLDSDTAETNDVEKHAREKLARKGCDWIIANDVTEPGVMGGDQNAVMIIGAKTIERIERADKDTVSMKIARKVADALQ